MPRPRISLFLINALMIIVLSAALVIILRAGLAGWSKSTDASSPQTDPVAAPVKVATSSTVAAASTSPLRASVSAAVVVPKKVVTASKAPITKAKQKTVAAASSSPVFEIARVQDPYTTPPLSFDDVNLAARQALVNILCDSQNDGAMRPISGSGIIIDPRGVILTNAHVAQYVLLSESPQVNLSCVIRTGSPARPRWTAAVLFVPSTWVSAHASEINADHPMGTGEYDYALLFITGSVDGSARPAAFPALSPDVRETIGFLGDPALGAAYPAEFIGGVSTQNDLNAVSSVSLINQLLTFSSDTVDMISIGGVIEAQSGSSGGAVVNAWDRLIGLITTTSDGKMTADRMLRAVTMSYIDRDIKDQTGQDLASFLQGDLAAKTAHFSIQTAPGLIDEYIKVLKQ